MTNENIALVVALALLSCALGWSLQSHFVPTCPELRADNAELEEKWIEEAVAHDQLQVKHRRVRGGCCNLLWSGPMFTQGDGSGKWCVDIEKATSLWEEHDCGRGTAY